MRVGFCLASCALLLLLQLGLVACDLAEQSLGARGTERTHPLPFTPERPAQRPPSPLFRRTDMGFAARGIAHRAQVSLDGALEVVTPPLASGEPIHALRLRTLSASTESAPAIVRSIRAPRGQAVEIEGPGYFERIENRPEGVEQSWTFAERPSGQTALIVRIGVEGLRFVAQTSSGLHFRDPPSSSGLAYGVGRWIDGAGQETEVVPVWRDGEILLEVSAQTLASSTYPAVLDPVISAEFGIDEPVYTERIEYTAAGVSRPRSAVGAGIALVVWSENVRVGRDIVASRVRLSDGELLDPGGILIASPGVGFTEADPDVAYDGAGNFLVVYRDVPPSSYRVLGRRVRASDGALVDPAPWTISSRAQVMDEPRVSFGAGMYQVCWSDGRGGELDIYCRRISDSGAPIDSNDRPIWIQVGYDVQPVVSYAQGTFLVSWLYTNSPSQTTGSVRSMRVRASDGVVLDAAPIPMQTIPFPQTGPASAGQSSAFFVVWHRGSGPDEIVGRRVDALTGVAGPLITISQGGTPSPPTIAADGTGLLVAWVYPSPGSLREVRAQRLDANLNLLDGDPTTIGRVVLPATTSGYLHPCLASDGGALYLSYGAADELHGTRVAAGLGTTLAPTQRITSAESMELFPEIGAAGAQYLVSWLDYRWVPITTQPPALYAARLDALTGAVLDPAGIEVDRGVLTQRHLVASDGRDYVLLWRDGSRRFRARRISGATGAMLDPTPLDLGALPWFDEGYAVAFDGRSYLVVAHDFTADRAQIQHLDPATGQLTPAPLLRLRGLGLSHSMACDGTSRCVLAGVRGGRYAALRLDTTTSSAVDALPIIVSSTVGPSVSYGNSDTESRGDIQIAFDGERYLLVYEDHGDIYGRLLAADGTLPEPRPFPIASDPAVEEILPSLTFQGEEYWVSWIDGRNSPANDPNQREVWGARIDRAGVLLDPPTVQGGFRIASLGPRYFSRRYAFPRIQSTGTGRTLVGYERWTPHPPVRTDRIEAVRIDQSFPQLALGERCVVDEACTSGLCVDGVCCATACGRGEPTDCSACSRREGAASDGLCAPTVTCRDGGIADSGAGDSRASDAAFIDSTTGGADASIEVDSGSPSDAERTVDDAALPERDGASTAPDVSEDAAAFADAVEADAESLSDAASKLDAGFEDVKLQDAGGVPSATSDSGTEKEEEKASCGCRASRGSRESAWWVGLGALALILSRRRRLRRGRPTADVHPGRKNWDLVAKFDFACRPGPSNSWSAAPRTVLKELETMANGKTTGVSYGSLTAVEYVRRMFPDAVDDAAVLRRVSVNAEASHQRIGWEMLRNDIAAETGLPVPTLTKKDIEEFWPRQDGYGSSPMRPGHILPAGSQYLWPSGSSHPGRSA